MKTSFGVYKDFKQNFPAQKCNYRGLLMTFLVTKNWPEIDISGRRLTRNVDFGFKIDQKSTVVPAKSHQEIGQI